jgi:hypothetical protein
LKVPVDEGKNGSDRKKRKSVSTQKGSAREDSSEKKSKSRRKKRMDRDRSNDTPNDIEIDVETMGYSPFKSGLPVGAGLKIGGAGVNATIGFSMSGSRVNPGLKLAFGTLAISKKVEVGLDFNHKS